MGFYRGVWAVALVAWLVVGCEAVRAAEPVVPCPDCVARIPAPSVEEARARDALAIVEGGRGAPLVSARRVWRCDEGATVVYQGRACYADSEPMRADVVGSNTWTWDHPKPSKDAASAPGGGGSAPVASPITVTAGMGPANSDSYRNCSGAACDRGRK